MQSLKYSFSLIIAVLAFTVLEHVGEFVFLKKLFFFICFGLF